MFIIAKYADDDYLPHSYGDDYQFALSDSAAKTHTGKHVGCPDSFTSQEEAKPWLEKMIEYNPTVGYAIVEVRDSNVG